MSGGFMSDPVAAELERHDFGEAVGGYTECSCGWPSGRAEYEAEPHAAHVVELVRPLIEAEVRERIATAIRAEQVALHRQLDDGMDIAAEIARGK